jgi:hypothetical protein
MPARKRRGEKPTMGIISATMVASVARKFAGLDLAGREQALHEVITAQPEPTGFVLALSRMGLPAEELDHVLRVLFVIAECFRRKARKPLPQITQEMLEAAARKMNAASRLLQDEPDESDHMTALIVESHKERNLFAYIMGYLDEHGLTEPSPAHEHAVFATAVVLEVFMQAADQADGAVE